MNEEQFPFKLPSPPPDEVFKNRLNRTDPAKDQWGWGPQSFIPQRFEYIKGKGNFVHYYGCPYPEKTVRPVEAIYATMPPKRHLINTIKFIASIHKGGRLQRFLSYFNEQADLTLSPYYLDDYYCNVVREIQVFVKVFLVEIGINEEIAGKTAEIIGTFFEYDNAYRYRINDVLNEADQEELVNHFPKELARLVKLEAERDNSRGIIGNDVTRKVAQLARLFKLIWYVPKYRKALKKAFKSMNFDNVRLDESDIYHTLLYWDYNTKGLSFEERMRIYWSLYPNPKDAPPRVVITNKKPE